MITNAYFAKRALFTLLNNSRATLQAAMTDPTQPVQVSYTAPVADWQMRSVYGGGTRFEHAEDVAEGPGLVVRETAYIGLYFRIVSRPAVPVEENDAEAATLGTAVLALIRANAKVGGAMSWVGVRGGQSDFSQTDDETISILAVELRFTSLFAY